MRSFIIDIIIEIKDIPTTKFYSLKQKTSVLEVYVEGFTRFDGEVASMYVQKLTCSLMAQILTIKIQE